LIRIVLCKTSIKIINHVQYYEFNLRPDFGSEMILMIKDSIDRERLEMEIDIFTDKKTMLKKLVDSL
jgi:predicted RNase H-related nuclease YkuK (DUF458 family)